MNEAMTTTEKLAELVRGLLAPHASFAEAAKLHDEAKKTLAAYDAALAATPAAPPEVTPEMVKAANDSLRASHCMVPHPWAMQSALVAAMQAGKGKEASNG